MDTKDILDDGFVFKKIIFQILWLSIGVQCI